MYTYNVCSFTAGFRRRLGLSALRHRLKGRVLRFSTAAAGRVMREHGLPSQPVQVQMLAGFPSLSQPVTSTPHATRADSSPVRSLRAQDDRAPTDGGTDTNSHAHLLL